MVSTGREGQALSRMLEQPHGRRLDSAEFRKRGPFKMSIRHALPLDLQPARSGHAGGNAG